MLYFSNRNIIDKEKGFWASDVACAYHKFGTVCYGWFERLFESDKVFVCTNYDTFDDLKFARIGVDVEVDFLRITSNFESCSDLVGLIGV